MENWNAFCLYTTVHYFWLSVIFMFWFFVLFFGGPFDFFCFSAEFIRHFVVVFSLGFLLKFPASD